MESTFSLNVANPTAFYGANNANITYIKDIFPTVRITARGNAIVLSGDGEDFLTAKTLLNNCITHYEQVNSLSKTDIDILLTSSPSFLSDNKVLIGYGTNGKAIITKNANQKRMTELFSQNSLLFASGPAGSGKTYLAIALAVMSLKNKQAKRIILSRPAVEAGEKIGFLPGDMKEKIDPFLQPLYDALSDMLEYEKLEDMMKKKCIQIVPLAFMRGRTLSDAIIILDEAQNATPAQIKMFLTRMGPNSKMILTGDLTQIDLPVNSQSGFKDAIHRLQNIQGVAHVNFDQRDIVRHPLVKLIVDAYLNDPNTNEK